MANSNADYRLARLLADGHFHSGESLGKKLGVSRAVVWHAVKRLRERGIAVDAVHGRGYRFSHPVELLDAEKIRGELKGTVGAELTDIQVHFEVDSTNRQLMIAAQEGASSGTVILTERQTAGRGRRGRDWISPFGGNLYLSLLWRFARGPAALTGLSLTLGVAVVEALKGLNIDGLALKWPNDIYRHDRKLAGLLLEVAGESAGPCHAVIGLGLNVDMPGDASGRIDQPWADLHDYGGGLGRNQLVAALLKALTTELRRFEEHGMEGLQERWASHDWLANRVVTLHMPTGEVTATARGIDAGGALVLDCSGERKSYPFGEVSVRIQGTEG